jgi:hypothetical protein
MGFFKYTHACEGAETAGTTNFNPNMIWAHIVITPSFFFFFFFGGRPFSVSGGAQTHLGAAQAHFGCFYAHIGLVVDTSFYKPKRGIAWSQKCLGGIHLSLEEDESGQGRQGNKPNNSLWARIILGQCQMVRATKGFFSAQILDFTDMLVHYS